MTTTLNALAESHYRHHQDKVYARTDRLFAWVMGFQYLLAVVLASVVSPRTWIGGQASVHPHVWSAVVLGGLLASGPILLAAYRPGDVRTRYVVAISQALFSALLIHLTGGRIETHFHVFGSLAFLAMYRDWRVLIVSSAIVALDHVVRGIFFPLSIYGVGGGAELRFLEHAAWVVFEDAFLLVACAHANREMRGLAERQAEVEIANERLEQASSEIARGSALLNSVLHGMRDGLVVTDPEGRYLHYNPAAETILGLEQRDIPIEDWPRVYGLAGQDGALYATHDLPLVRAIRGESVFEELRAVHVSSGQQVWLEISAEPLLGENDDTIGGVALFRDVTERKRIHREMEAAREEAERANRAKSEFLSRMSHELRTPMNAILGFGQILQMDDLTEDQEESLDQILRAGKHLLRLINEILDISGIEAGKLTISKEPVDAPEVAREVLAMVSPLAATARVTLVAPTIPRNEAFALADQQRLRQVMLNLVSNAIKYNVAGGEARVEIEQERGMLRVVVRDTGPGIPEEMQGRLFNPFERLGAQNTSIEGTGLGLALSKRLCEAMGGTLALRAVEVGACFVAEFPIAQSLIVGYEEPDIEEAPMVDVPETKVLLIEDNPANVRLVQMILRSRPHLRLLVATDGTSGLEVARSERPAIVLLDLDLPGMRGLDVLRRLRSDRNFDATRIVVVSADASESTRGRALALQATACLSKPFDVKALLSLIDAPEDEEELKVA